MATISRAMMLGGLLAAGASFKLASTGTSAATGRFEVHLSEAQWRARLTAAQFAVLRESGTEVAGSSPLEYEKRPGIFTCAGCALALFDAKTKFDSGTGWPSFYEALPHAVGTSNDTSFAEARTEVHCRRCGGHIGHVFDDGPRPTGLRYCMNGVALSFKPRSA